MECKLKIEATKFTCQLRSSGYSLFRLFWELPGGEGRAKMSRALSLSKQENVQVSRPQSDITFGAGLFFVNTGHPDGASKLVHSMDRFGNERPGWPVALGAPSMASPERSTR